jgi:hypothetical protein
MLPTIPILSISPLPPSPGIQPLAEPLSPLPPSPGIQPLAEPLPSLMPTMEQMHECMNEILWAHQHIHVLETDREFLEDTVEHLAATRPPPSPTLQEAVLSKLAKWGGKRACEILAQVKAEFPGATKHDVNSVLYKASTLGLAKRVSKQGMTPLWRKT